MRKLTVIAIALALLTACSGASASPESLNGSWTSTEEINEELHLVATISNNEMVMTFVDANYEALYWKGTVPPEINDGEEFFSEGDTDAMDQSLLGSMDETKMFEYKDGQLSFKLGIMGVTQTIFLERD